MLNQTALRKYSMDCPPMSVLPRTPEVQAKYNTFIKKNNNRCEFITNMKAKLKKRPYYFTPNDFPYATEGGIEHWVCWYERETCPHEIIADLRRENHIITYWKNHSHNMSIQEINHIHIFIRK